MSRKLFVNLPVADLAAANGGTADVNATQDPGFMYSRSLADPDGHVWEMFWMDPTAVPAGDTQSQG